MRASNVVLLTGATGFLGQRLLPGLASRWRVVAPARTGAGAATGLELTNPLSLAKAFRQIRPAAAVHAAGLADPDACERDPALAHDVNVAAVEVLAELCAKAKVRLVHFSTDHVFDGARGWYREDDPVRPLSAYGRTKLAAERAVLSLCPGAVVLRVSNCYGRAIGTRRSYLDHWHDRLASGGEVRAFTDQWRTPTAADQLPEIVARLLERPELSGIFHWGGADRSTRHEAALIYCQVMGFDERLVQAASASMHAYAAPRPRDSSLDSSKLASALGIAPIGLRDGFQALKSTRP